MFRLQFISTLLTAVLYAASAAPHAVAAPPDADKPIDIAPAKRIDSRLFAAYAVEDVYRSFPVADAPTVVLATWFTSTKTDLTLLVKEVRSDSPDEELDRLVRDCQGAVEAYETFLVNLGIIDRLAASREGPDGFMNGSDAGKSARSFYDAARARGNSAEDALGGAVAVGLVDFLVRDYNAKQAREAERERAIAAETRKLREALGDASGRGPVLARKLEDRHGWTRAETPFTSTDSTKFGDLIRLQPRNPFAIAAYANIRTQGEKAEDIMRDARRCVEACRLVPEAYAAHKVRFLSEAGRLASVAAMAELGSKGFSAAPGTLAPEAVRYWRTVDALRGHLTEFESWKLSEALSCSGRYQDALQTANKAFDWANRTRNSTFLYNYVCNSCLAGGDTKVDLKNLGVVFAWDSSNVSPAKTDPDLARLRREQREGFDMLTKVKADYKLVFGVFDDDVKMSNNSAFALTNVVVETRFKQDGKVWTRRLNAPIIRAGETYTWKDCISIPDSRVNTWHANLSCDQDK